MSFYPPKISERFYNSRNAGKPGETNAVGTGASFICGSFIRFYLRIDSETKEIKEARYKSNGCGYVIAAAEVLAEKIVGEKLTRLHGFDDTGMIAEMEIELGKFSEQRKHCAEICFDALRRAFSDFRSRRIEEFAGEQALICTCFGVSEKTIEKVIEDNKCETVEDVTIACGAGGGCGSCSFLIQELIDVYRSGQF